MASTFKVPIAVQLLARVDRGEVRLDQMIEIQASDLHPGSGTLTDLFNRPGLALSVRNLLELMMLISDNSATDVLLRLAGGPEAVTASLRSRGITGIDVSRPTNILIADWLKARNEFDADPRDTSTPDAMADLFVRIHRKEGLKPESAELLLDIMRRCRTGEARLKGMLPRNTEVAHKTGTIGGSANDVGIMSLPDGGRVAIAVFVKSSSKDVAARERSIAEIARAVHDFFLFLPK
jgi:beta-lactamase class A